jgi:hypothetical protein
MKKWLILWGIALLFYQCSSRNAPQNSVEKKPLFTLFRTVCFGTCPSYSLEVYEDKTVVYNGLFHTEPLGKRYKKLSSAELSSLKKKFQQLSIHRYADFYPENMPVPQDIPSIIITSNYQGKEKKIEIKGGRAPIALQEWIEELENLKSSVLTESNVSDNK